MVKLMYKAAFLLLAVGGGGKGDGSNSIVPLGLSIVSITPLGPSVSMLVSRRSYEIGSSVPLASFL